MKECVPDRPRRRVEEGAKQVGARKDGLGCLRRMSGSDGGGEGAKRR